MAVQSRSPLSAEESALGSTRREADTVVILSPSVVSRLLGRCGSLLTYREQNVDAVMLDRLSQSIDEDDAMDAIALQLELTLDAESNLDA